MIVFVILMSLLVVAILGSALAGKDSFLKDSSFVVSLLLTLGAFALSVGMLAFWTYCRNDEFGDADIVSLVGPTFLLGSQAIASFGAFLTSRDLIRKDRAGIILGAALTLIGFCLAAGQLVGVLTAGSFDN